MIIHQTLHGYYKGHGLLASSFPIGPSESSALLSSVSDWTGYHAFNNSEDCYLTTYPLPDGENYAIAKSWYADDIDRPGCVWTHTLIFKIDDLSKDIDLRQLQKLFKRPIGSDYSSYSTPLDFENVGSTNSKMVFSNFDTVTLLFLFTYVISGNNGLAIFIEHNQQILIDLVMFFLQYIPKGILAQPTTPVGGGLSTLTQKPLPNDT